MAASCGYKQGIPDSWGTFTILIMARWRVGVVVVVVTRGSEVMVPRSVVAVSLTRPALRLGPSRYVS